jgi:hypothetical protein
VVNFYLGNRAKANDVEPIAISNKYKVMVCSFSNIIPVHPDNTHNAAVPTNIIPVHPDNINNTDVPSAILALRPVILPIKANPTVIMDKDAIFSAIINLGHN